MSYRQKKNKLPLILRYFKPSAGPEAIEIARRQPRRILLIKQAERLGNVILLNSAISALSSRFPSALIDLLLPSPFAEILSGDPRIQRIIPVYKRLYIAKPWKLLSLIKTLRAGRYDLAIDCSDVQSPSATGNLYTLLSGAAVTAGWRISDKKVFDIETPRYDGVIHASKMYLKLLSGIFGGDLSGSPFFPVKPKPRDNREPLVGINCGGRGPKRWSLDKFIALGSRLADQGVRSEFILGPDENHLRNELNYSLPARGSLLPPVSIVRLKGIIADYAVFISSDTGPMHLAWTQNIPVVALFLESEIEKFKPLSKDSVVIDVGGENQVDIVAAAVREILDSRRIPA